MPRAANRWANAPKLETPSFAQLNECEDERWSLPRVGGALRGPIVSRHEKKRHLNQLKAHVTTIKERSK